MQKINYKFVALSPLFTGSDENTGIVRTLRREKVMLKNPITYISTFENNIEKRKEIMNIIYPIYCAISQKLKSDNYGFYEAYSNKVKAATSSQTKYEFLNRLIEDCSIATLPEGISLIVKNSLDKFNDIELLETIRNEHHYLMILLRDYVSKAREKNITDNTFETQFNLFENNVKNKATNEQKEVAIHNIQFVKRFENVPYFSGNSIRGLLRRLIMSDFCKQVGITKLQKSTYHQLFTGGNITESTGLEDIENREKFIKHCPAIGLLGSAIGNSTIEGELKVFGGRLQCLENQSSEVSFWEQIKIIFSTRHDDSKTENQIIIIDEYDKKGKQKEAPTTQMYYQYETFVKGSIFDSSFVLTTDNEVLISCFWRMIQLWKENNYIGGNSARDTGLIDLQIDIPFDADKLYLDYLEKNKNEILRYFHNV